MSAHWCISGKCTSDAWPASVKSPFLNLETVTVLVKFLTYFRGFTVIGEGGDFYCARSGLIVLSTLLVLKKKYSYYRPVDKTLACSEKCKITASYGNDPSIF